MKQCSRCKIDKPLADFAKRSKSKDGLQSYCKECRKIVDSASYLKYPKRRDSIKARRVYVQAFNRKLMKRYKAMCGCLVCTEREPVALDFHHLDPSTKDGDPSTLSSYSTSRLKDELRKCAVLCANCHRKVHAGLIKLPL